MVAVGKLKYKLGDNNYESVGSASIIIFKGELFIATAAHCLFDFETNDVSRDVYFEYMDFNKRNKIKVSTVAVPQKWIDTHLLSYDYAFGRIELPKKFYSIAFYPEFNFSKFKNKHKVCLSGYQLKMFSFKLTNEIGIINSELLNEEGLIGISKNLKSGISGGPWYFKNDNKNIQIGVTSAKIKRFKNHIWAPVWTSYTQDLLEKLISSKNNVFY